MTTVSRMWNESDDREFVAYYMEKLRRGDDVFHDLSEAPDGDSIVPLLVEEFRRDSNYKVRTELINVISEFRLSSSIPFFAQALRDPKPSVWKAAIDAFFKIPSAESLAALESAIVSVQDEKQRNWFAEAIHQMKQELAKNGKSDTESENQS